jgi:hypothetical protein
MCELTQLTKWSNSQPRIARTAPETAPQSAAAIKVRPRSWGGRELGDIETAWSSGRVMEAGRLFTEDRAA